MATLQVSPAFVILSLAPIRGLVPRENRSCLKVTQKPIRMDCDPEFSKNGPALEASTSLEGSSTVQGTVVGGTVSGVRGYWQTMT